MLPIAKFVRTQFIHALPRLPLQIAASVSAIMLASWFTQPAPKAPEAATAEILTLGTWQVAAVNREAKQDRLSEATVATSSDVAYTPAVQKIALAVPAGATAARQSSQKIGLTRADAIPPRPLARPCLSGCAIVPVADSMDPVPAEFDSAAPSFALDAEPMSDDRSILHRTSERLVAALTDMPLVDRFFH